MRDLTDEPFGVNIAQAFVDPAIAEFVIEQESDSSPLLPVTDEVHSNIEGRRSDRVPRRSHVAGCPESRRCRS